MTSYGHFSDDGREYVITDPRTPRPWANVIANRRFGLAVAQSGSGFTWIDNSQLAVVNWWQQDFAADSSGKFIYAHDPESGETWSLSPAPVWADSDHFACRHGIGYTTFDIANSGIESSWTLFAHAEETVELWLVRLGNRGTKKRTIELTGYLEWCCGVTPAPRREFHKLFIETAREGNAVFGWNHMWDVGSKQWGHWNTDFPYVAAFGTTGNVISAEGDKTAFLGRNGTLREPAALGRNGWPSLFGRHYDPVAAMRMSVDLAPGEEKSLGFVIAVDTTREAAAKLMKRWLDVGAMDQALGEVKQSWIDRLAAHRLETPDARFDTFVNDWVRYQAIAARIWGRAGYYQQSGAFGFRDQLQDSQVWLTIDPKLCREQIALHARHQFADGSVYHWWHPLSELGHVTKMTDDLLWLVVRSGELHPRDRRRERPRRPRAVPRRGEAGVDRGARPARVRAGVHADEPARTAVHRRRRLERRALGRGPRGKRGVGLARALPGRAAGRVGGDPSPHRPRRLRRRVSRERAQRARRVINDIAWDGAVVLARHARLGREDRQRVERGRADLPERADLGHPQRHRSRRPRRLLPCLHTQASRQRVGRAPSGSCVHETRRADRLHHALRTRPARERRRLHACRNLGHRGRREDEGPRARRTSADGDRRVQTRIRNATGPSLTSSPATSTAPTRRITAAPAGPGTPAPPPGCTASSPNGSSASGPNGTASASIHACRPAGSAPA